MNWGDTVRDKVDEEQKQEQQKTGDVGQEETGGSRDYRVLESGFIPVNTTLVLYPTAE